MQIVGSVLYGADEAVAAMVAARVPWVGDDGFGPCRALGLVRGDRPLGGIVFHNFKGATIEMSGAFDRADWIRPATLWRLQRWWQSRLRARRIIATRPSRSPSTSRLGSVGFTVLCFVAGAGT